MISDSTVRPLLPKPVAADDLFLTRSAFIKHFNYSKPNNQDEVDASINREIGNITTDKASIFDYLFALGSVCTFIADITTDVLVARQHFMENNYIWFGLTVAFIVIPSLLMQFFSCKWFRDDYLSQTWWTYALHFFQLGTIERYLIAFWYGLKTRCQSVVEEADYVRYLTEWRDITLLRLFEGFLEAAPQTVLQLYILSSQKVFIVDRDWLTATSAIVSIISLSWAIVAYSHMLRLCVRDKGLSICGYMFQISYRLFMVSSRVAVLVLFASVYRELVFIFVFVHCAVMFAWLNIEDTVNESLDEESNGPCSNKVYTLIVSIIYLYCFLTVQKSTTRRAISIYYLIIFVESAILMALWFPNRTLHGALMYSSFGIVFGGFILGILCMMLYYKYFHPSQDITEGWLFCQCFQQKQNKEQENEELILNNTSFKCSKEDQELVIIDIRNKTSEKLEDRPSETCLVVGIELQRPASPSRLPSPRRVPPTTSTAVCNVASEAEQQRAACLPSTRPLTGLCRYGACDAKSTDYLPVTRGEAENTTQLFSSNNSANKTRGPERSNRESCATESQISHLNVRMSGLRNQKQWDDNNDLMRNKTELGTLELRQKWDESIDVPKNLDRNGNSRNTNKKNTLLLRQGSKDDTFIQRNNPAKHLKRVKSRANSLPEKDFIRQNLLAWVKEKLEEGGSKDHNLTNDNTVKLTNDGFLSTIV